MADSDGISLTPDIDFAYSRSRMTPETFRAELDALGIYRQVDIAAAIGISQSTVSSWLNGESRIPPMVSLVLQAIKPRRTVQGSRKSASGRARKVKTPKN